MVSKRNENWNPFEILVRYKRRGGASFTEASQKIPITIECKTTPSAANIDAYVTLQSNDTIVKDDSNTSVSIYHNTNGNKKVCLNSGTAHIVR